MKISVVIACYNAQAYLRRTLDSIVGQHYAELELIVMDGGSSDSTLDILNEYRGHIAHLYSGTDDGQYAAISAGLELASGEVLAWLNADDFYMPWTLEVVAQTFQSFPDVEWVTGQPTFADRRGVLTEVYGGCCVYSSKAIRAGLHGAGVRGFLQQESMFWRRDLWRRSGGLDTSLRLAADFDLWVRFAKHADLVALSVPLAAFRRLPGEQRSSRMSAEYCGEVAEVVARSKTRSLERFIARRAGLIVRSACRLLLRSRGRIIVYDSESQAWRMTRMRSSASRVTPMSLVARWLAGRRPQGSGA